MTQLAYSYKINPLQPPAAELRRLRALQLTRLNATIAHARAHSRFYQQHLAGVAPNGLASLEDLPTLPLMDAGVFNHGLEALLCVSPAEVSRIVTLETSGATGEPKRVAFTAADQQATRDYFAAGMRMLADAGEAIAVLYPCERPGGLGALLLEACEQMGARPLAIGIPNSFAALAASLGREQARGLVGFPQHVFSFARWCEYNRIKLKISGVLLSADNVAATLRNEIARIWNCDVFEHFGMTESGYGGAVDCPHHQGLHVRESDLIVEVIDPLSGQPRASGQWGELVISTLGREAMPLLRYRTGDHSRLLTGTCPCGSPLKRISSVRPRAAEQIIAGGQTYSMAQLEESLFALPGVLDFKAELDDRASELLITVQLLGDPEPKQESSEQCSPKPDERRDQQLQRQPDQSIQKPLLQLPQWPGTRTIIEYSPEFRPYYPAKRTITRLPGVRTASPSSQ
ncbi:MAG: hypothetical protein LBP28_07620 [Coriobacteriales bacterium]|nr:hypothetical protein [Coriobacteriales bacterium]